MDVEILQAIDYVNTHQTPRSQKAIKSELKKIKAKNKKYLKLYKNSIKNKSFKNAFKYADIIDFETENTLKVLKNNSIIVKINDFTRVYSVNKLSKIKNKSRYVVKLFLNSFRRSIERSEQQDKNMIGLKSFYNKLARSYDLEPIYNIDEDEDEYLPIVTQNNEIVKVLLV